MGRSRGRARLDRPAPEQRKPAAPGAAECAGGTRTHELIRKKMLEVATFVTNFAIEFVISLASSLHPLNSWCCSANRRKNSPVWGSGDSPAEPRDRTFPNVQILATCRDSKDAKKEPRSPRGERGWCSREIVRISTVQSSHFRRDGDGRRRDRRGRSGRASPERGRPGGRRRHRWPSHPEQRCSRPARR